MIKSIIGGTVLAVAACLPWTSAAALPAGPAPVYLLSNPTAVAHEDAYASSTHHAEVSAAVLAPLCAGVVGEVKLPIISLPPDTVLVATITSVIREGDDLALSGEGPAPEKVQAIIQASGACAAKPGAIELTGNLSSGDRQFSIGPDEDGHVLFTEFAPPAAKPAAGVA